MSAGRYAKRVRRHASEDKAQRRASRRVESLLDRLEPGINRFPAADFQALVAYFLGDDIRRRDQALSDDRFRILEVEIVCERKLTFRNGVTVSEFARQHSVPQQTLCDRAGKAGLRFLRIGNRKFFFPADLASLLPDKADK